MRQFFPLVLVACAQDTKTAAPPRPEVEVRALVDKAIATTGDVLTFALELVHADGYELAMPEVGAELGGFRIIDSGNDAPKMHGGRTTLRRWYKLRADLVGSYVLPPVTVQVTKAPASAPVPEDPTAQYETSEIFVEVASVLPEGETATDIRDVKAPKRVRPQWLWYAYLGGGAALVLLAVGLGWWWWRKRRGQVVVETLPPHEVAYRALEALRHVDFADSLAIRRYYFGLSEVLRQYVEARFQIQATDLTTEELVPRLSLIHALAKNERDILKIFLVATDRVKFAAHAPDQREIQESYEAALQFVERTVPKVVQEAA